jgi:hypothetical protein
MPRCLAVTTIVATAPLLALISRCGDDDDETTTTSTPSLTKRQFVRVGI